MWIHVDQTKFGFCGVAACTCATAPTATTYVPLSFGTAEGKNQHGGPGARVRRPGARVRRVWLQRRKVSPCGEEQQSSRHEVVPMLHMPLGKWLGEKQQGSAPGGRVGV